MLAAQWASSTATEHCVPHPQSGVVYAHPCGKALEPCVAPSYEIVCRPCCYVPLTKVTLAKDCCSLGHQHNNQPHCQQDKARQPLGLCHRVLSLVRRKFHHNQA